MPLAGRTRATRYRVQYSRREIARAVALREQPGPLQQLCGACGLQCVRDASDACPEPLAAWTHAHSPARWVSHSCARGCAVVCFLLGVHAFASRRWRAGLALPRMGRRSSAPRAQWRGPGMRTTACLPPPPSASLAPARGRASPPPRIPGTCVVFPRFSWRARILVCSFYAVCGAAALALCNCTR